MRELEDECRYHVTITNDDPNHHVWLSSQSSHIVGSRQDHDCSVISPSDPGRNYYCYIVICWFMQKYTYICWIHTDAIIIKTPDDKVARTNGARKEDTGRLLYKIFYLWSLFVSFERVVLSLRVRESWRPKITEIFWPRSYGRQRCVFLVLHGCSTGPWSKLFCVLAFLTTPRSTSVFHCTACPPSRLSPLSSIRRPYITFKLPRSNIDTPAQPLPISSDWGVSLPSGAPPWMAFLAGSKSQNITLSSEKKTKQIQLED